MWIPNLLMGGAGIYLLKRNAEENPVKIPPKVARALNRVKHHLLKLIRHDLPA